MENEIDPADARFLNRVTEATIRVGLLALLVGWCLAIVMPFLSLVVWGAVMAIAVAPLHARVRSWLGGRNRTAAVLIALLGLTLLVVPVLLFIGSSIEGGTELARRLGEGQLTIPPPAEGVAEWPLVGEKLAEVWTLAAEDTAAAAKTFAPQLEQLAAKLMAVLAGLGLDAASFALAIVIAGVLLAVGDRTAQPAEAFGVRVAGEQGRELVRDSVKTVRSVAQGVVGIAVIQAVLAGVGMLLAGVPGAGLWALLVLIVAVIQLPPIVILGPVAAYVFTAESTGVAVAFLVWALLVSGSDAVLKPLLLGRGVQVPMLVILIGAIGGMMTSGILGLFLGAVVLSVGYRLFMSWIKDVQVEDGASAAATTAGSVEP